jgi:hypothetical protein
MICSGVAGCLLLWSSGLRSPHLSSSGDRRSGSASASAGGGSRRLGELAKWQCAEQPRCGAGVPRAAAVAGGGAPGRRAVGSQKRDAGVAARRGVSGCLLGATTSYWLG